MCKFIDLELDGMVAEDDKFRNSNSVRKQNRAERRANGAHKKHRLGKKFKYASEEIDAYYVEKVDGKKVTHWIGNSELKELEIEKCVEAQKYWADIPWEKVKGINPKTVGYSRYERAGKITQNVKARREKFCEPYETDDATTGVEYQPASLDDWTRFYSKSFNNNSAWHWQLTLMKKPGFFEAKEMIRLSNEIEIIENKKQRLLEEYANKIEYLNNLLHSRLEKMKELKEAE